MPNLDPNPNSQTSLHKRPQARLCIVVPCYNEQEVLPITSEMFIAQLDRLVSLDLVHPDSSVLFVDDGSVDRTWETIESLAHSHPQAEGLKLSRNRGHQNALLAGLMEAHGRYDVTISIDCDGQDDIRAMEKMMRAYYDGNEVVYGVRSKRDTDTFMKRCTAEAFYKLLNSMGVESVFNHADYRLLSSTALDALSEFRETNLFLRGMIPLLGFDSDRVEYERHERFAGESHYPLSKMIGLAFNGITSLSIKPIRLISGAGIALSTLSVVGIIWALAVTALGNSVTGWASTLCAVLLIGGLQLLALGIIGEYVGRIYLETKQRPRYIIEYSTLR